MRLSPSWILAEGLVWDTQVKLVFLKQPCKPCKPLNLFKLHVSLFPPVESEHSCSSYLKMCLDQQWVHSQFLYHRLWD